MKEKKLEDYIGVGTDEPNYKIKYKTSGVIIEFIIPKPTEQVLSDQKGVKK